MPAHERRPFPGLPPGGASVFRDWPQLAAIGPAGSLFADVADSCGVSKKRWIFSMFFETLCNSHAKLHTFFPRCTVST